MNRRAVIIGAIVAVVLLAIGAGVFYFMQPVPSQPLRVAMVTYPGDAIVYLARDKGFFGDLQVNLQVIDDWRARHAAFKAGQIDLMYTTVDSFAMEAVQLRKGKILFATSFSHGADAIVGRRSIRSAADLKGKRIAYAAATPSHFFLAYSLQNAGLTLQDVNSVTVDDPSIAGQAFIGGKVDAAVTWEPFVSQAKATPDGHIILSSAQVESLIIDVFTVSDETFAKRRADLQKFVDGALKAIEYVKAHPEESATIMAKGMGMPLDEFKVVLKTVQLQDRPGNRKLFGIGSGGESRVAAVFIEAGNIWRQLGIIEKTLSPEEVIDLGFLKEVLGER